MRYLETKMVENQEEKLTIETDKWNLDNQIIRGNAKIIMIKLYKDLKTSLAESYKKYKNIKNTNN